MDQQDGTTGKWVAEDKQRGHKEGEMNKGIYGVTWGHSDCDEGTWYANGDSVWYLVPSGTLLVLDETEG